MASPRFGHRTAPIPDARVEDYGQLNDRNDLKHHKVAAFAHVERHLVAIQTKTNGSCKQERETNKAVVNYALTLHELKRFEDVKALLRKLLPVARRVLGENNEVTLRMTINYAMALYVDTSATLDDIREAVTTLEDTTRIGRRVFGGAHPLVEAFEVALRNARSKLSARETPSTSA